MRLPAMSLKKTLPSASTAGPSRKQMTAPAVALASGATRPSGTGTLATPPSPANKEKAKMETSEHEVAQCMLFLHNGVEFFDSCLIIPALPREAKKIHGDPGHRPGAAVAAPRSRQ